MAITYTNRKKDKYYLHKSTTKKGNSKYYFSKSPEVKMVDKIPDGYEIYENPNAQVFLRRMVPRLIDDAEIGFIRDSLRRNSRVKDHTIDIRGATLTIYLPDQTEEELSDLGLAPGVNLALRELLLRNRTFTPMMRFRLIDKANREFVVERYYFSGKERWIYLDSGENLLDLSEYCRHLGRDSFFELL